MDAATEQTELAINKARGRKDSEGQEAVIKSGKAKDEIDRLVNLKGEAKDAAERYNDAIKYVAEQAGLLASVLRKFVGARVGEKYEDEKRKAEQLQLCFDEIGEGGKK